MIDKFEFHFYICTLGELLFIVHGDEVYYAYATEDETLWSIYRYKTKESARNKFFEILHGNMVFGKIEYKCDDPPTLEEITNCMTSKKTNILDHLYKMCETVEL